MEDINESSSESGITVYGINNFPLTPHKIFKKAYEFHMAKNEQNKYKSRIGFNFYQLPAGTYTFVVEFFPPTTQDVSIDCRSTSINVNHQIFKSFPGYWKNLVQLQKFKISPPEYLMVDIESQALPASSPQGTGWMIVYGVEGTHSNVSSTVLDTPVIIDNGEQIMQVKLNMNMKELFSVPDPIHDHDAATKKYVDESGINTILNLATSTYIDGYIKENAECLYSVEKALKTEVVFDGSERRVSTLFDQTLSLLNSNQTLQARQPALSTTKNAKRYFLTFDGSRRMVSSLDLNADSVHIFILFRLKTNSGSDPNFSNGLFGHDNGGWDKFVCFVTGTSKLLIGGTTKDGSQYNNGYNTQVTSLDWKTKANASELNKWCCLSVHWDVSGGEKKSSCWVNTKKIKSFTARSSTGSTQMTFGDLNPNGVAGLDGDIQLFLVYKGSVMSDRLIRAHHKMICERYGVDHEVYMF